MLEYEQQLTYLHQQCNADKLEKQELLLQRE